MTNESRLITLLLEVKSRYHARGLKVPPPPWEVEDRRATWKNSVQVVQIELERLEG